MVSFKQIDQIDGWRCSGSILRVLCEFQSKPSGCLEEIIEKLKIMNNLIAKKNNKLSNKLKIIFEPICTL